MGVYKRILFAAICLQIIMAIMMFARMQFYQNSSSNNNHLSLLLDGDGADKQQQQIISSSSSSSSPSTTTTTAIAASSTQPQHHQHTISSSTTTATTTTTTSSPQQQLHMFALLTDPRCIDAVPYVIENALEMLPESYKVVYLYAKETVECVNRWVQQSAILSKAIESQRLITKVDPNIKTKTMLHQHLPNNWNNIMYTNVTFWESLKESYGDVVITIQADTYICQKGDVPYPRWKSANYLGGLSHVPMIPVDNYWNATNTNLFMNGGFSIRNLNWVVRCLLSYKGNIPLAGEDTVFNTCYQQQQQQQQQGNNATTGATKFADTNNNNGVVQVVDAMSFSSDGGYTLCFDEYDPEMMDGDGSSSTTTTGGNTGGDHSRRTRNNGHRHRRRCPYGVHQPWRLGRSRGRPMRELLEYCPGIQTLSDKLGRNETDVAACLNGWRFCK